MAWPSSSRMLARLFAYAALLVFGAVRPASTQSRLPAALESDARNRTAAVPTSGIASATWSCCVRHQRHCHARRNSLT
jgi:hypothetical protein